MDLLKIKTQRWDNFPEWMQVDGHWGAIDNTKPHSPSKLLTGIEDRISFDGAKAIVLRNHADIGLALNSDGPFIAILLEDVAPFETLPAVIKGLIGRPDTYCEVSESSNGLQIICFGERIPGRQTRGKLNQGEIKVCDNDRCIALTGIQRGPCGDRTPARETEVLSDQLSELQRQHLPKKNLHGGQG